MLNRDWDIHVQKMLVKNQIFVFIYTYLRIGCSGFAALSEKLEYLEN